MHFFNMRKSQIVHYYGTTRVTYRELIKTNKK